MNKIMTKNESWLLLKKEVEDYVNKNQNYFLDFYSTVKIISLITLYFFGYINVLYAETYLGVFLSSLAFGFSLIELGFLAHCFTHNSLYTNKKLNGYFSFFWDFFMGISKESWKYKHNAVHHVYTNIHNKDEDIDTGIIFHFSPYQKKYWFHKYQWIYGPFLYSLLYIFMFISLGIKYFLFKKRTVVESVLFISGKILFLLFLFFPFYMQSTEFAIIYILTMSSFASLYASFTFATAHVFNETYMSDEKEQHDFLALQVSTTSNYSTDLISTEIFFGLNYQLEHHLFPQLHYYYYPKINHIVKKHIAMNNLTYHEHSTFFHAIVSHIKYLKKIGK